MMARDQLRIWRYNCFQLISWHFTRLMFNSQFSPHNDSPAPKSNKAPKIGAFRNIYVSERRPKKKNWFISLTVRFIPQKLKNNFCLRSRRTRLEPQRNKQLLFMTFLRLKNGGEEVNKLGASDLEEEGYDWRRRKKKMRK